MEGPPTHATPLAPGQIVAGKYRVESLLGEGGMGLVLGARHMTLDERVAIKMLREHAITDREAKLRFLREARAAGRMRGEHVARVLDVGEDAVGTPYIVMEHLEGMDLADILKRQGPLDVRTAVDFVLQACEALAEAHALGIVHRDLKPSNLFVTRRVDGSVCLKVLDFGIAKAVGPTDEQTPEAAFTATQSVLGTPQYMAPEQMRSSRRADARSDIWAVGSVLYELLVGHPPYMAATMPELFAMILQDPTPSMRETRKDVPPALDAVYHRCLEKHAHQRFPNVHELAQALAPFGGPDAHASAVRIANVAHHVGSPLSHNAPISVDGHSLKTDDLRSDRFPNPPVAPSSAAASVFSSTQAPPPRSPLVYVVLALVAIGIAGVLVGGFALVHRARRASPALTTTTMPVSTGAEAATTTSSAREPPSAASVPTVVAVEPVTSASAAPSARASKAPVRPGPAPAKTAGTAPPGTAPPSPASAKPPDVKPAATASSRYD